MRSFVPPSLQNPQVAERLPGSMFTPAIAAWSSPGALGALGLPSWAGYAGAAAFLALAYFKKIPWWIGLGGAAASYYYLGASGNVNTLTPLTSGVGIVANGSTLYFSANTPATLITAPDGTQTVQAGQATYPVLSTQSNADGTTTYYLDNPSSTVLPSA